MSAAVIGNLRAVLSLDAADFQSGVVGATKSTRRLEGELENLGSASRVGAAALQSIDAQVLGVGRSMGRARADVGNLAAQFQDIGVMLAAGQSPLTLAIQQGTQIGAVLGASGGGAAGAVKALGAAFMSIVSPVNLITIGTIAAGAALTQWLMSGEEEAKTLGERIDGLGDATDRYTKALDASRVPLAELRKEWGEYAEEKLADLREMAEIEGRGVQREAVGLIEALEDEFGSGNTQIGLLKNLFDFDSFRIETRHAQEALVGEVIASLNQLSAAAAGTLDEQIAAFERYYEALETAAKASGSVSGAEDAKLYDARQVLDYLREVKRARDEESRLAEEAASNAESAWRGYYQSRIAGEVMLADEAERGRNAAYELAAVDLAKAFEDAQSPAERLVGIIERGQGILQGWAGAIGDFVASFAPDAELAASLAGMTDGVAAASALIREQEGFQPTGKWDVNAFRAGYGSDTVTLINDLGERVVVAITEGMAVSRVDAERDLQRRITTEFMPRAMAAVGEETFAALSATQQAVLTSLTYNYGSLPDTVAQAVREGSEAGVAGAIRALGTDNEGVRMERRQEEAALYAGAALAGIGETEAAAAAAAEVAREAAEAERERTQAITEAERERTRATEEAARVAERELGLREDLIAAAQRQTQDAELEASLVSKSAEEQARLRAAYILTNQAVANGIDLNEQIAGSTQTYGQMIEEAAAAAGAAAGQEDALTRARDAAAESAQAAAAEMQRFVSSLTNMALGPVTSSPIGGFLGSLPGFTAGAESVIGGFMTGGFGAATSALTTALGGATTGLMGLGTAIGAIAGPVGAAIGLFNALKGSTEVLDTGFTALLKGLDDVQAWTWEVTQTTRLGGLLTSTDSDVDRVTGRAMREVEAAFGQVTGHVLDLSETLGIGADAFEDFRAKIEFSTEGMSPEQVMAELADRLGKVSDKMARMAGVTGDMILPGETATQALERLSASLAVAEEAGDLLNLSLFDTSIAGAAAASAAMEAAGGLDAFASSAEVYFANFYSLAEQAAERAETFNEALAEIGIATPIATVEQFRAEVERLEAAGDPAAASLIALSDEFVAMTEAAEAAAAELEAASQQREALLAELFALQEREVLLHHQQWDEVEEGNELLQLAVWAQENLNDVMDERYALETELLQLQGDTVALRERELEELSPYNRALKEQVWALEDAKDALDALNGSDFASLFDFQKAQGLASAPANTNAALEQSNDRIWRELAAMRAETRQLQVLMEGSLFRLARLAEKADKIGTPPVRAA